MIFNNAFVWFPISNALILIVYNNFSYNNVILKQNWVLQVKIPYNELKNNFMIMIVTTSKIN